MIRTSDGSRILFLAKTYVSAVSKVAATGEISEDFTSRPSSIICDVLCVITAVYKPVTAKFSASFQLTPLWPGREAVGDDGPAP